MLRLYSLLLMGMLLSVLWCRAGSRRASLGECREPQKGTKARGDNHWLAYRPGDLPGFFRSRHSAAIIRGRSHSDEGGSISGEVAGRQAKAKHTHRSRRWGSGRRCPGCCCRLQGRCGWLRSRKQQRQTRGQRGRCRYWGRDRVAVRWASCHLPCKVPATTLAVANADRVTSTESKPFLTSMLHVRLPDIALSLYSILVGNWRQTLKSKFVR